jgi:hypothetical protein
MQENTDECVLQMRFISYLTENTVCLYDGARGNAVIPRIMLNPTNKRPEKIQHFVRATPDGTLKYHWN